jgi:hypothetical protein
MIEFIAVALFLALVWFFLKFRKKSADIGKNTSEPVKPKPTSKPVDKVVIKPETITTTVTQSVAVESEPVIVKATIEVENSLLPQDSVLQRHYLTHVSAMVTSLSPLRPSDSTLVRHYNAQITAKIEHCLHNEKAMEQLVADYIAEKSRTIVAPVAVVIEEPQVAFEESVEVPAIVEELPNSENIAENSAPVAVVEEPQIVVEVPAVIVKESPHSESNIPEDSTLRRHYLTHLYTQIAATLSPRPTDSVLRRHYDSLLENAVKSQLR